MNHTSHMRLCVNCLTPGALPFPIGPDQGSQRDPYRHTLDLCEECAVHLMEGNVQSFANSYMPERNISR